MTELLTKSVLFGLGGLCVGAMSRFISDPTPADIQLGAPYTHLQRDPILLNTLQILDADFRTLDPEAYTRIIQAIDALLGLQVTLSCPLYEPLLYDRVQGVVYFRRAKTSIQRFIQQAERQRLPRQVIILQRHSQTIMTRVNEHLKSIIILTRDMHIHP
jgi:hypothetical protein